MTREEAKEILTHNWTRVDNPNYSESELDEAFFMAIRALANDKYYEEMYDIACKVIEGQAETIKTYHKIFLLQEAELNKLRADKCVSD